MSRLDPHSYADDAQPRTKSFAWTATVDFDDRTLRAEVTLRFTAPAKGGPIDLDTRELAIESVVDPAGAPLTYALHEADAILGSRLEIMVPAGADAITIRYSTSPQASALQWLTPGQTSGKKHPYLFSQCQAIHARSVLPCQDTPSIRQTFTASLDVPKELRAVMAAAPIAREEHGARAIERFEMPQSIPPYLFAFAVGDLASKDLSKRTRVWTEPSMLAAAAWEFDRVEDQLQAAEALFGPYDWDRYDFLVMPPSFPYGGMENPRLTFLTPSLVVGDRSLVNVLAHELAHSWTGNLVTNATAEHFWLNEGFTVFAERRILEALEGAELAGLHAAMGYERLLQSFEQLAEHPELTKLRTKLTGVDPDESFSNVPYEKGYFFLKTLEAAAGRVAFDRLLATWLGAHRFGAVTTEEFLALVEKEIPGLLARTNSTAWLDEPGMPVDFQKPTSPRLEAVRSFGQRVPTPEEAKAWSIVEWMLYLETMPKPAPLAVCAALDATFSLTSSKNSEVLVSWLTLAVASGYAPVLPRVEEYLVTMGRMKYLKPLYTALARRPETKKLARDLFERVSENYHPIAAHGVRGILKREGA